MVNFSIIWRVLFFIWSVSRSNLMKITMGNNEGHKHSNKIVTIKCLLSSVCVPFFMYAMQYFRTLYVLYSVKCLSVSNDGECTFSPSFHAWQYASFELRRGYFPLLVLFRKWGKKGVYLRMLHEMQSKLLYFNIYWRNIHLL